METAPPDVLFVQNLYGPRNIHVPDRDNAGRRNPVADRHAPRRITAGRIAISRANL